MFYVAMSKKCPDKGFASCVGDGGEKLLKQFYRDYAGCEIRLVDGEEMMRLMSIDT